MRIEGNKISSRKGYVLRRLSDKMVAGTEYYLGYIWELNGKTLDPPHLEMPEDFEEVPEDVERYDKECEYPLLVEKYIRERYTVSDELAIQRQRDMKKRQYLEYYYYCEDCKARAKQELGL